MEQASLHQEQSFTWKPTLETRVRYERRIDKDFSETARDNRTDGLLRVRAGVIGVRADGAKITLTYQYGYDAYESGGKHRVVQNSDVYLANYEFKSRDWTTTLGRQGYVLGDGRLVSSFSYWGNVGRTFEGVRTRTKNLEFVAFREGANSPYNHKAAIGVAAMRHSGGLSSVILKQDRKTVGTTEHATLNHIAKWKRGKLDATAELSAQFGKAAGLDHRAWAGVAQVAYSPNPRFRGYAEFAAASGGVRSDKSMAFDPLYANTPLPHGMGGQVGFKNSDQIALGFVAKPDKRWTVEARGTLVMLRDASDAWYDLYGKPNAKPGGTFSDPTGASGKNVGGYFQLEGTYQLDKHHGFTAGIGTFAPGSFIKRQTTGNVRTEFWGFGAYTYRL